MLGASSELRGVTRTAPIYVVWIASVGVVGGGAIILFYGVWRALVITLPENFHEGLVSKYRWASRRFDYLVKPVSVFVVGVGLVLLTITALTFPPLVIAFFYSLFSELLGF